MRGLLLSLLLCGAAACSVMAQSPLVVVIDPGHGGQEDLDESSANNASFYSAKLKRTFYERDLTLEMGAAVAALINQSGKVKAVLTRSDDRNVGMTERARIAHEAGAAAFVSLHFNASGRQNASGTVAVLQSVKHGNTKLQHAFDADFGLQLVTAIVHETSKYDPKAKAREPADFDAKPEGSHLFKNLRSQAAGKKMHACFLEIEFMDNPRVARWLLEGKDSPQIRQRIAAAIAGELVGMFTRG